ncbi:MAG: lactate utilization protein [Rhodobacteraceae bacterium]|nr:MAG: lactate utilization protein [Paracoccaceae bacterium]
MSAREAILARVRKAAGGAEGREAAVAARLAGNGPHAPRPAQARSEGAARLELFEAKARAADATVARIATVADLPAALAAELRARNLPATVRTGADPLFVGLDWGAVERTEGVGRLEEPATLSRAEFGLAETGTLALASGPMNPVTLTFLGETHFVALPTADVMAGFEDFWAAWRARGLDPRTLNFVTGPSRSADIGQTLQLGAHGPVALHIFLIG